MLFDAEETRGIRKIKIMRFRSFPAFFSKLVAGFTAAVRASEYSSVLLSILYQYRYCIEASPSKMNDDDDELRKMMSTNVQHTVSSTISSQKK